MDNRKNIIVLMGGRSPEHEISLISGKEVVRNLDTKKYNVNTFVIKKDGKNWQKLLPKLHATDLVFIAMHGPYGEDGTVQGLLDLAGVKYTGSGVLTSSLTMDKNMTRQLLSVHSIPMPKSVAIAKNDKNVNFSQVLGKFPYFVKPNNQGSSVGMSIVRKKSELKKAITNAFKYSDTVLVDEYIKGKEITCAILGNKKPETLPLVEIIPKAEFFDYDSKYLRGGAQEIVPARISEKLTKQIQTLAIKIYKIMGCKGFARVDFILRNDTVPLFLEVNTIPGLTPMSLFPKAAKSAGILFPELVDKIISNALF
ncbi:MAG: D-alanine-D-alanine ligase Ddl [Candidatus Woesebacteria bacterium GW2011_GWB1_38_5b]|uniref:D-alanine--D-alanine ligase n=1 Tax=Candidatus Woesebacteria bacterium GW2011_GWB1_38_5b TaxID=1618569 RepID=A0A0G0MPP7_9BACT|nr:MAG: D-alanine-D-alanine ligase Ddl [Candidatus Woesebacteria bacterium GW2011_GWB1_38_5b]